MIEIFYLAACCVVVMGFMAGATVWVATQTQKNSEKMSEQLCGLAKDAFLHLKATSATELVDAKNARDYQQEALRQVREAYEDTEEKPATHMEFSGKDGRTYRSDVGPDGREYLTADDGRKMEVLG